MPGLQNLQDNKAANMSQALLNMDTNSANGKPKRKLPKLSLPLEKPDTISSEEKPVTKSSEGEKKEVVVPEQGEIYRLSDKAHVQLIE